MKKFMNAKIRRTMLIWPRKKAKREFMAALGAIGEEL